MRRIAVIALLLVGCAHAQPAVDEAVRATIATRNIPGAAVAVVLDGRVVFARGYGVADRERGTPVTADTIFQIASTTKPFTAIAVLLLVEEGKLDLDAPALRHLDWLPAKYAAVTIRQLLTHTSGVARDLRRENVDEFPRAEFLSRLEAAPASFAAGQRWEYSNTGYALLSFIVEEVSGEEFGAFLRRRIFLPLGMTRTAYRAAETHDRIHAVGYDFVDGELRAAPHVYSGWGNSGIESTANDLAKFAAAIDRGRLLRAGSYRKMFTSATPPFEFHGAPAGYGFGWFITTANGRPLITHGGAIAGFSSMIDYYPSERLSIVVLSNSKQGADRAGQAEAIARAVAKAISTSRGGNT